jgi:hypothetical protein
MKDNVSEIGPVSYLSLCSAMSTADSLLLSGPITENVQDLPTETCRRILFVGFVVIPSLGT